MIPFSLTPDGDGLFDLEDVPGTYDPVVGMSDPGAALGTTNPATGKTYPSVSPCPPGHSRPRDGHQLPQVAGGDLPFAFDWSTTRGVSAVDPRGFKIGCRTLDELIRYVPRGATVVGESTFESYDLRNRERIIRLAEERGVVLLTVPARGNTWRRAAAGMPEKNGQSRQVDYEDALAIQRAAVSGAHLKKPAIVDEPWAALRERAAKRFVHLRFSGEKNDYALEQMRRLPPYVLQPAERRIALGPTESYNAVIVAAVAVAAEFVSDRAGFERLTGLYAHGYPSQFRSDLMHWGWGRSAKKQERIRLTVYRRELRWLFHQLRETRDHADRAHPG